jgi:hypothetical protein
MFCELEDRELKNTPFRVNAKRTAPFPSKARRRSAVAIQSALQVAGAFRKAEPPQTSPYLEKNARCGGLVL